MNIATSMAKTLPVTQNVLLLTIMVVYWFAIVADLRTLHFYIKPSVLILILILFLQEVFNQATFQARYAFIAGGFAFSALGDFFLLSSDEQSFQLGLASFAVAHIGYLIAFSAEIFSNDPSKGRAHILAQTVGLFMYYAAYQLNIMLQPTIPDQLKDAVYIYTLLISSMVALAMYRSNKVNQLSFLCTAIGSVLFAVSDSILAVDTFVPGQRNKKKYELAIMVTYYLAQLLIYNGAIVALRCPTEQLNQHVHSAACAHGHTNKGAKSH